MAYKDPQAFFGGLIHGEAYIRMGEGGVYTRNHISVWSFQHLFFVSQEKGT